MIMLWTGHTRVQFLEGAKTSLISKKHGLVLGRMGSSSRGNVARDVSDHLPPSSTKF